MINTFMGYKDQMAQIGNQQWSVTRLIRHSKKLPVMNIPLEHLNVANNYSHLNLRAMVMHMKAVNKANLKYPIILDEDGEIMDGRHRIMKALLIGKETIKAVRFATNPTPDETTED